MVVVVVAVVVFVFDWNQRLETGSLVYLVRLRMCLVIRHQRQDMIHHSYVGVFDEAFLHVFLHLELLKFQCVSASLLNAACVSLSL